MHVDGEKCLTQRAENFSANQFPFKNFQFLRLLTLGSLLKELRMSQQTYTYENIHDQNCTVMSYLFMATKYMIFVQFYSLDKGQIV